MFRVLSFNFGAKSSTLQVLQSEFRVLRSEFQVLSLEFRVLRVGFRDRSSIGRVRRLEGVGWRAIPAESYANAGVLGTVGGFTELSSEN